LWSWSIYPVKTLSGFEGASGRLIRVQETNPLSQPETEPSFFAGPTCTSVTVPSQLCRTSKEEYLI